MLELSVIIINNNQSNNLTICLNSLICNKFPKNKYEIIVIDNNNNQKEFLKLLKFHENYDQIRIISQKKQGFSVARNKAIEKSRGKITVFLSADSICKKNFLEQQHKFHQQNKDINIFCLGKINYKRKTQVSTWLETKTNFLEKYIGSYFNLSAFDNLSEIEAYYASLNNLSCKTKILKKYPFDPWFDLSNGENIELLYRIKNKNTIQTILNEEVSIDLNTKINLNDYSYYLVNQGENYKQLHKKFPLNFSLPRKTSKQFSILFSNNLSLYLLKILNSNIYMYAITVKYFLLGLNKTNNLK